MTGPLGSTPFAERILAIHRALQAGGVGHGFGGAVALAFHVRDPRATADIDINIHSEVSEAAAVLAALPSGIEVGGGAVQDVTTSGQVRLWWDSVVPVDLFFPQHEFHAEVARETTGRMFAGVEIPVISATHLTVFKSMYNRSRDWVDIEAMLEAGTVETARALDWLDRLLGRESEGYSRLAQLTGATS